MAMRLLHQSHLPFSAIKCQQGVELGIDLSAGLVLQKEAQHETSVWQLDAKVQRLIWYSPLSPDADPGQHPAELCQLVHAEQPSGCLADPT